MARHCQDFQEQNWSSGVHDLYSPAPAYENASEMRLRHNCINATAGFARSAYASHASTQRSSSSSTLCRHTRMAADRVVCRRYTAAHRRRLVRVVSMQFRRSRPDIVSGCCVLGLEYDMPPNSTSTGGEILQRGRTSDQSVLKVAAGLIDLYTERRETDPCPANS